MDTLNTEQERKINLEQIEDIKQFETLWNRTMNEYVKSQETDQQSKKAETISLESSSQ